MSKALKQILTITLSVMMVLTSVAPIFAESSQTQGSSEKAEVLNIDNPKDNADTEREAPSEEKDLTEEKDSPAGEAEDLFASMTVSPEKKCEVYPVLIGHEYGKDRFAAVEWADYIDPKENDAEEFYAEYLTLQDKKISDKEKAETADKLNAFVEKQLEDAEKSPKLEDLGELPLGLYYIAGEGLQSEFAELTEEDEYKAELDKEKAQKEDACAKEYYRC